MCFMLHLLSEPRCIAGMMLLRTRTADAFMMLPQLCGLQVLLLLAPCVCLRCHPHCSRRQRRHSTRSSTQQIEYTAKENQHKHDMDGTCCSNCWISAMHCSTFGTRGMHRLSAGSKVSSCSCSNCPSRCSRICVLLLITAGCHDQACTYTLYCAKLHCRSRCVTLHS
jgi:hypothetical protein